MISLRRGTSETPGEEAPATPLPAQVAVKPRRRPLLIALAVAFLAVSAIGGWALLERAASQIQVVAVAADVTRGQVIERDQLTVVAVPANTQLATVPADQLGTVIGQRARRDLTRGGIVSRDAVGDQLLPARKHAIVGVLTKAGSAPVTGVQPGAQVLLVPLPETVGQADGGGGEAAEAGSPVQGTVVAVAEAIDQSGARVDVDVLAKSAAGIQQSAAAGRVAIVVVSQER